MTTRPIDRLSKRQIRDRRAFQNMARRGVINVTGSGLSFDPATNTLENTGGETSDGGRPTWYRIILEHSDFTEAIADNEIFYYTLPAGAIVHAVVAKTTTAFDNAASGGNIDVGQAVTPTLDYFISNYLIEPAPSGTNFATATVTPYCGDMTSEWELSVRVQTPGKVPAWFTTGALSVWILVSKIGTDTPEGLPTS